MPNKIQSQDNSRGGDMEGISYNFVAINRWNGKRKVNVNRNDDNWNANYLFPGVRNSFHFSPACAGEFCFRLLFCNCPLQPPSILPISSSFIDKAIYFLLSIDLASHNTIKSIFTVSVFRMASLTHGCFSSRGRKVAMEIASIISTKIVSIFWPSEYLCIFGRVL